MNQRITGFERNESKVANLLATIDELVDHDKIAVLVECITELQKQNEKLEKSKTEMDKHVINILEDLKEIVKAHQNKIEEQEKAFQKLRKQFEDHKVLTTMFRRKEAEFQKHEPNLKKRNESLDKDVDELRAELGEFAKSMKEQ